MKNYRQLMEELTHFQKKYVDDELGKNYNSENVHVNTFNAYPNRKHSDRIILDYNKQEHIPEPIKLHLESNGWHIHDYLNGYAKKNFIDQMGNHRTTIKKIGKILKDTNGDNINIDGKSLTKIYESDPYRKISSDNQVIISRDKYDIAGMSTGRHWESCMALPEKGDEGGCNHRKIKNDLDNHSLVAYLTNKGDDDIENPHSRILIKKYKSTDSDHYIYRPDSHYGIADNNFHKVIDDFCKTHYPKKENEKYILSDGLYDDEMTEFNKKGKHIDVNGDIRHYNENGLLHDYVDKNGKHQPASVVNGTSFHYKNGKLHFDGDMPSVYSKSSDANEYHRAWYKNGLLHREGDSPSEIIKNDSYTHLYHKYGMLHRTDDKPAHYQFDVDESGKETPLRQEWFYLGQHHREGNKPAVVDNSPFVVGIQYFKHGIAYSPDKHTPASEQKFFDSDGKMFNHVVSYANSKGEYHTFDDNVPSNKRHNKIGDRNVVDEEYRKNGKYFDRNGLPNSITTIEEPHFNREINRYYDEDENSHSSGGNPSYVEKSNDLKNGRKTLYERYSIHGNDSHPDLKIYNRTVIEYDDNHLIKHEEINYNPLHNDNGLSSQRIKHYSDGSFESYRKFNKSTDNDPIEIYHDSDGNSRVKYSHKELEYLNGELNSGRFNLKNGVITFDKNHVILDSDTDGNSKLENSNGYITHVKDGSNINILKDDKLTDESNNKINKKKAMLAYVPDELINNKIGLPEKHYNMIKEYYKKVHGKDI